MKLCIPVVFGLDDMMLGVECFFSLYALLFEVAAVFKNTGPGPDRATHELNCLLMCGVDRHFIMHMHIALSLPRLLGKLNSVLLH